MNYPKVFIIILNYNGKNILKNTLESVYKINYPNYQVVVVDNASTDGSFEEARLLFGKFNFIKNNYNAGFAAGNNVAIKWSLEKMADYVFLLNNDAITEKDTLLNLINEAEKDSDVGILSPIVYKESKKKIWFSGGRINWLKMRSEHVNNIKKTQYITGCAMLIKKEVFKKIGLLDEKFFLYYEDADFSLRATRNKFKLKIVPSAKVFHLERSSENLNKIYYLVFSGILFFRKNSNYPMRAYIELYLMIRKIKNRYDILVGKNKEKALLVKKAYDDAGWGF
ncbi:MAG: Glycosyl transferase family 2 [Candidatus Moranbacteria bacterium GW2011_GWE1_35_17]|nr:MAG: Glycosyl transferase family 2 [Candidatus Moranbacteria bacterium GW2011_GWE1_35_17]KKP83111.1 MAG: Glycosyl transferase family 2 [Candidatus Moranbacteria bacterium GW2011_GWF2_35_54]KKP83543.1 MAG: Glycosyl transferase family 2 [Candidatus Moranbacteria bacterium GW2011_GWF1_35_5]